VRRRSFFAFGSLPAHAQSQDGALAQDVEAAQPGIAGPERLFAHAADAFPGTILALLSARFLLGRALLLAELLSPQARATFSPRVTSSDTERENPAAGRSTAAR